MSKEKERPNRIVARVIHTKVFVAGGNRVVEYYKGLLFFERWTFGLYQIPEADVPDEFKKGACNDQTRTP